MFSACFEDTYVTLIQNCSEHDCFLRTEADPVRFFESQDKHGKTVPSESYVSLKICTAYRHAIYRRNSPPERV
jgi:hypothetical protein